MLVWWRGEVQPAGAASVPVDDRGVTVGQGVFSTLRAIDGQVVALRRHLDRLADGAARLGIALPHRDAVADAIREVVGTAALPDARVRVTVTAGRPDGEPFWWVTVEPRDPPAETASVVISPWPRNERAALAGVKTTSYAENTVARAWAAKQGAEEVLFPTTTGLLCEGSASNVFVVRDGRLATPALDCGCLPGVIRALVVEWCGAAEEQIEIAALQTADEVFLTSSLRHVQPVRSVEGRSLPASGPVTQAVVTRLTELLAHDPDP